MGAAGKAICFLMIRAGYIKEKKFNRITKEAALYNKRTLRRILKKNKDTEYGRKYKFSHIDTPLEYRNTVPLVNYDALKPYIKRMAKGERYVLMVDKPLYFGITSGTTGEQKLIPATRTSLWFASGYMGVLSQRLLYKGLKDRYSYGRGMVLTDMLPAGKTEGGIPVCSATSGGMKSVRKFIPLVWTSPPEAMELEDRDNALYLHLLFALKDKKLMYISGVFISAVLDAFRFMESNWRSLVEDIRRGKISVPNKMSKSIRDKLMKKIQPDSARALELEREFSKGFKGITERIWPKLICLFCVTGGSFSVYDSKTAYYTNNLTVYSGIYAATEALVGINPYMDKRRYAVTPDTAYFEFIPLEDMNSSHPIAKGLEELSVGSDYEVVVTTYTGLYRYRMGDVVRVTGYFNSTPELEFLYRKNQLLNIAAEKTTEQHVQHAIHNCFKGLDVNLVDYTSISDISVSPGRYVFFVEIIGKYDGERLARQLECCLSEANPAYGRIRHKGKLAHLQVKILPEGTFKKYRESLIKKGVSRSQQKIPRVISHQAAEKYFNYGK